MTMTTSAGRCAVAFCVLLLAGCGGEDERGFVRAPVPMPDPTPVEYPVELWDLGVTGETVVNVHVNEMGNVDSVAVDRSSGYAEFDSSAVRGARRLRFTPGRRDDRPIPMWTKIPVRFAQDSSATFGAPAAAGVRGTEP